MPDGTELHRLASLWAAHPTSTCFAALAEALRKRGVLDEAAAVATAGVAARPEYLPGHVVMARILSDQGRWEAAHGELQAALLLDATHPLALEALDVVARRLTAAMAGPADAGSPLELAAEPPVLHDEPELDGLVYSDDDPAMRPIAEPVVTESLAMLYRGQGHLAEAVDVLDALVARAPDNEELVAKRNAMRAELDVTRPRPFDAAHSGGAPVRQWLSALASAPAPAVPPVSNFDAFFQAPNSPSSEDGDLAAFQAWLAELDR